MMKTTQSLDAFYKQHFERLPAGFRNNAGHFNIFQRNQYPGPKARNISYSRKNFYKISLITGKNKIYYADQIFEVEKSALLFSNPLVPYGLELISDEQSGFFCIFSEDFFENSTPIKQFPLFKPGSLPVFLLTDDQMAEVTRIYRRMLEEIHSDFVYKYDLLRNLVLELTFMALKILPLIDHTWDDSNGAARISSLFTELLERQFPIAWLGQTIQLRGPADFADRLSVHINYLNRSLKETTGKTTSALIAERMIREARELLMHTNWSISEIAWCLGFKAPPHFITFFKNSTTLTPKLFRKKMLV